MRDLPLSHDGSIAAGSSVPAYIRRAPFSTSKCIGPAVFRSQEARDYALLMDLYRYTRNWTCHTAPVRHPEDPGEARFIDFVQEMDHGKALVDVLLPGAPPPPPWMPEVALEMGACYVPVSLTALRLELQISNARELAAYVGYRAKLGDRIRLVSALKDEGHLTLGECLALVREGDPMATVAALAFSGFLEIDIEWLALGPDTIVFASRKGA